LVEPGDTVGGDGGFRSSRQHDVGCSPPDQLGGVADGVSRCRTGGDDTTHRPEQVVFDGGQTSRHVGDDLGNPGGADSIGTPVEHQGHLVDERTHPSEAGADHHPGSFVVRVIR
jgi:hypothetical protein